ncbi:MAG: hypothetical protein K1X72_14305 [Pyrinomonadaceae bacterium]|nr:hypothetical protein [Pyrinomonadaceae bacterium]
MFFENEKENEKIANNFSKVVDSMTNKQIIWRFLLIGLSVNFLFWLAVLLIPELIYKGFHLVNIVSDKLSKGLLGIPLMLTTFTVYAIFRLKLPNIEDQKLDSELMASYAYQAQSTKRFWVWIISFMVGIINTLLLIMTDLVLNKML